MVLRQCSVLLALVLQALVLQPALGLLGLVSVLGRLLVPLGLEPLGQLPVLLVWELHLQPSPGCLS